MMRAILQATVFAALFVVVAGCTSQGSIQTAYKDAPSRYYNSITGGDESTKTVTVPAGSHQLTVKAKYNIMGGAEFTLKDPGGATKKHEEIGGSKKAADEGWFVATQPTPGAWRFDLEVGGTAEYAFGFYY